MKAIDGQDLFGHLAAGLRARATDSGDEAAFARQVAAAATALPQRRASLRWADALTRRTGLILVAGLLATGLVAAAIGSGGSRPGPLPSATGPVLRNGPILVIDTRQSWWIDPGTGGRLTGADYPAMPEGIQDASFSTDGRRAALVVDGVLELFDLATGDRTVLLACRELGWPCLLETERRFSIAWSPDGRSIAVVHPAGLSIIDVASGQLTPVTPHLPASVDYSSPTWSPDGRWIAFADLIGGYVEAVRPDGTGRHRVSAAAAEGSLAARNPSWAPDGKRIYLMTSEPFRDTGDIVTSGWMIRATAQAVTDGVPVGEPVDVAELVFYHCLGFCPTMSLSPDGASLLLDSGEGMFVVPVDGSPRIGLGNEAARPLAWRPLAPRS